MSSTVRVPLVGPKGHKKESDSERIDLRLSPLLKSLFEEAASATGVTLSAFIKQVVRREAEEVIERERVIRLTKESTAILMDLLENPPEYNERMRTAMQRASINEGIQIAGPRIARKRRAV